jgi:heme/copper-type cytochrome/quinol oxidase subunit 2
MEVCGRYHHWMPILVKIVHRDQFLIWCMNNLKLIRSKNFKYENQIYNEILLKNITKNSENLVIINNFFNSITNYDSIFSKLFNQ